MLITVFILIIRVSRIEKYLSELQNSIDKQSKINSIKFELDNFMQKIT